MHIRKIKIRNFKTFRSAEINFLPNGFETDAFLNRPPKYPNINLLLGNNGSGKTALLQAIALACMGPGIERAGLPSYRLMRREVPTREEVESGRILPQEDTLIKAKLIAHDQDDSPFDNVESEVTINRGVDPETDAVRWTHKDPKPWYPIDNKKPEAFFLVGYGASRRIHNLAPNLMNNMNSLLRDDPAKARGRRVMSLFNDEYSLIPLRDWLPNLGRSKAWYYSEIRDLINSVLGFEHYEFSGELENGEFLYSRNGLRMPFPSLSDGYRAFLAWLNDLLFHIWNTCPEQKSLKQNHGIVLVDEIDLHIHPKWQMELLPKLSNALPNIQFIVTSHSPLVVGSLEWMNIIAMQSLEDGSSIPKRFDTAVHGLNSDQILLTEFFGLKSTRADAKARRLKELTLKARAGDDEAADLLLKELSRGLEEEEN